MRFRIRWPFVRRWLFDQVEADLGNHHILVNDLAAKLNLAARERQRLEEELSRLRMHFDDTVFAKDEAFRKLASERDGCRDAVAAIGKMHDKIMGRLEAYGLATPDWAASTDPFLSSVVIADFMSVRGRVGL